jgi:hypothetical protein
MTRRQYQDLSAADLTAIPEPIFDAQIIVGGDQVACGLVFGCLSRRVELFPLEAFDSGAYGDVARGQDVGSEAAAVNQFA